MVVFTCNHCGDTLHKPKVEKHYQFSCRNFKSLTCVDCLKDFRDEEYVVHTKCLTEDERYAAKGTYKNGLVKKGDVKQESWLEMIKSIVNNEKNLKPSLKNLLETISEYSNVPRKKAKFLNFIKSSSGGRVNMKEIEDAWNVIEKYKSMSSASNKNENIQQLKIVNNKNGEPDIDSKKRSIKDKNSKETPKKKKKLETSQDTVVESAEQQSTKDSSTDVKFNFKEKILEILNLKGSLSKKKLQKKVLKAYIDTTGETECSEKIIKKYNTKLSKVPNIDVQDDKVVLLK